MRIAQVTPFFFPTAGGVENAVENISKNLVALGHEVVVYTADSGLVTEESIDGITVKRFPVLFNIGTFAKFWPGFINSLRGEKFDVIHTHVYRHPHSLIVSLYSKLSHNKSVISTHGPFHPRYLWGHLGPLVDLYDRLLGRTLNMFDRTLILAELERPILRGLGVSNGKIEVLSNGVEAKHLARRNPRPFLSSRGLETPYLCYLGRLHSTKGLDFLLKSFARISNDEYSHLVIAGAGSREYTQGLHSLSQKLGISGRVSFTGYLTEDEKMFLLEGSHGLVLPSRYEPYGIVLLEAMAHAKPVIATYPGGTDFVKENHNGFVIRYGDEEALAEKMSILFQPDVRKSLGKNAQQFAARQTWEIVAQRLEKIYQEVAA